MKEYPHPGGLLDEAEEATKFMPFAGKEGYTPVAYAPYILAAAIGNLLRLDFPSRLLLMRTLGLIAFTMVAAYAVKLTPALKWTFVLIAMLPRVTELSGATGCGRSLSGSWGGRISCFRPGLTSCSRSCSCSCHCKH
jgi:Predicted membrane protein (DUF2142)